MSKKKILIRIGWLEGGGAEKVLVDILNQLDSRKYEIDLLLNVKQGVYLKDVPNWVNLKSILLGTDYIPNIFRFPNKIYRWAKMKVLSKFPNLLYKIYTDKSYDIEIAFNQNLARETALSPLKCKKIVWIHSGLQNDTLENTNYTYLINSFSNFDKIITVSHSVENFLKELKPNLSSKIETIYNPVNKNHIQNLAKEPINIKLNSNYFTCIGRLEHEKNHKVLIEAIHILKQKNILLNLAIIGDGHLKSELKELVGQLELTNQIQFLSFLNNPYPILKNSEGLILPSLEEGFSLVIAEAFCLGKAVITTPTKGPIELIENGKYGELISFNPEEIAYKLEKILANTDKKNKLEKQSIKRSRIFDIQKTIIQIEYLFNTL